MSWNLYPTPPKTLLRFALRMVGLVCLGSGSLLPTCREPARVLPSEEPAAETVAAPEEKPAPVAEPAPTRVDVGLEVEGPDQWLRVEKIQGDAAGAWATGSFNPQRNKLDIRTRDVAQFTIDVQPIPIDWERLVVIRIDGSNSELIRRDYSLYRFVRDEHGQWVVAEP